MKGRAHSRGRSPEPSVTVGCLDVRCRCSASGNPRRSSVIRGGYGHGCPIAGRAKRCEGVRAVAMNDDEPARERTERAARAASRSCCRSARPTGTSTWRSSAWPPTTAPAVSGAVSREPATLVAAERLRDLDPTPDEAVHSEVAGVVSDDRLPADPWDTGDPATDAIEQARQLFEALAEQDSVAGLFRVGGRAHVSARRLRAGRDDAGLTPTASFATRSSRCAAASGSRRRRSSRRGRCRRSTSSRAGVVCTAAARGAAAERHSSTCAGA